AERGGGLHVGGAVARPADGVPQVLGVVRQAARQPQTHPGDRQPAGPLRAASHTATPASRVRCVSRVSDGPRVNFKKEPIEADSGKFGKGGTLPLRAPPTPVSGRTLTAHPPTPPATGPARPPGRAPRSRSPGR